MSTNIHIMNRCPLRPDGNRREGAVLAIVLMVVLLLGILAVSILKNGEYVGVEASRGINDAKAFWAAEAGLHHARGRLFSFSSFRDVPYPFTSTLATGIDYSVTVVNGSPDYFTITSTGVVQGVAGNASFSRAVRQTVLIHEDWRAFDYALFGGNGNTTIGKLAMINGDVFQNGNINFTQTPTVTNGNIEAVGTVGNYPRTEPPVPLPEAPVLKTSVYSNLINIAAVSTNVTYPTSLAGKTNNVRNSITISGNLVGPGMLVVNGDVSINTSTGIGSNLTIVAKGEIHFTKDCATGANCILYSNTGFDIQKDNAMLSGCMLITPGDMDIDKEFTLTGVLYAGGTITLDKAATVYGCIVAGEGFDIAKEFTVVYTNVMNTIPPGFVTTLTLREEPDWVELF